jgi:hypothetical protein
MRECDVGTREWKERRSPSLLALLDCSLVVQYLFRSGNRRYETMQMLPEPRDIGDLIEDKFLDSLR